MIPAFGGVRLDRPRLMAIVNVTPDSFSDGGERFDAVRAVEDGLQFVAQGADIIDVGGESTRPGALATPPEEELRRVLPVVRGLAAKGAVVSIDTRRASVARPCLDAGARIVNDVSALRDDPSMLRLVAQRSAAVVLVHRRGRAEDKYRGPAYVNVVEEVRQFLAERARACTETGIAPDNIVVDPGIGFGKRPEENLALIGSGERLATAGHPVLIGSSRKGFIGRLTGITEPKLRDPSSVWLAIEALRRGAAIARVHDIAATRQALAVWLAMR